MQICELAHGGQSILVEWSSEWLAMQMAQLSPCWSYRSNPPAYAARIADGEKLVPAETAKALVFAWGNYREGHPWNPANKK